MEIVKAKRESKSQFNNLRWAEFWEIKEGKILKFLGQGKELKVSNSKELMVNKTINKIEYKIVKVGVIQIKSYKLELD